MDLEIPHDKKLEEDDVMCLVYLDFPQMEDLSRSYIVFDNHSCYNQYHSVPLTQYLCHELDQKNGADEEVNRILAEYMKNNRFDRAGKKTEMLFWLDIEEILSCCRKSENRHLNLSSIWSDFRCGFGQCPPNSFTEKEEKQRSITGNSSYQLDYNKLLWSNRNVPRCPELEFQCDYTYEYNQHIRKKIVRRVSSFVISTIVFLGILFNLWSSLLPISQVQPLHKELGLLSFMVFLCAVAVMILVGASFTSMQKSMLIFLIILMHLKSASSIREAFLPLLSGLFMGWYAFGKNQPPNEVI